MCLSTRYAWVLLAIRVRASGGGSGGFARAPATGEGSPVQGRPGVAAACQREPRPRTIRSASNSRPLYSLELRPMGKLGAGLWNRVLIDATKACLYDREAA